MMPGDCYSRHIVVLDGVPETTEVLQALLEPQGIRVTQVQSQVLQDELACDLVVIHQGSLPRHLSPPDVPRILVDCDDHDDHEAAFCSPFHYGDLLNKIQELLEMTAVAA